MRLTMRGCFVLVLTLVAAGGCQSNQALVMPCCYAGPVTLARLADLDLVLASGRTLRFGEALPGLTTSHAPVVRSPAILDEFYIARVGSRPLAVALAPHDANRNGRLEEPELTAFYVWEAARGAGHDVVELRSGGSPVGALQTSVADLGSLLAYVSRYRERFAPRTAELFRAVEREAEQQRIESLDGGESRDG